MKIWIFLSFILLPIFINGCASNKLTEKQKHRKLQKSVVYKSYQTLSKATIGSSVKSYNKVRQLENKSETTKGYIHGLFGFIWTMALRPTFAIAETDLTLKSLNNPRDQYIGLAVQSIAFYEKGWRELAQQNSLMAKKILDSNTLPKSYEKEQQVAMLIIGSLAIYEGDSVMAQDSFKVLGDEFDKPWLPLLAQGASLFTSGSYSEAFRLLKGLSNDEHLSETERQGINHLRNKLQNIIDTGELSSVSVGRLTSEFVFDVISEKTDEAFTDLVYSVNEKLKKARL